MVRGGSPEHTKRDERRETDPVRRAPVGAVAVLYDGLVSGHQHLHHRVEAVTCAVVDARRGKMPLPVDVKMQSRCPCAQRPRKDRTDDFRTGCAASAGKRRARGSLSRAHPAAAPPRGPGVALPGSRDGTALFADVSGFTELSEQLARKGREGAEQITDTIGGSFASILKVAYENGASLLKFGGDALLLWFQGARPRVARVRGGGAHARRRSTTSAGSSCRAPRSRCRCRRACTRALSISSRSAPRTSKCYRRAPRGAAPSRWNMPQVPARSSSARRPPRSCPPTCSARPRVPAVLLLREPPGHEEKIPYIPRPKMAPEPLLRCLSPAIRAHVLAGGGHLRAPSRDDRVHPLRGNRRADRARGCGRPPPRRCTGW